MSDQKPTVALVHGAFAESASWNPVIERLQARGLDAVAIVFRYPDTDPEPLGVRLHHLLDDPLYLLSTRPGCSRKPLSRISRLSGLRG